MLRRDVVEVPGGFPIFASDGSNGRGGFSACTAAVLS